MIITKDNFPALLRARWLIEQDNGGDLIGTVYPVGAALDPDSFEVPQEFEDLVASAEAGLALLDAAELETMAAGEQSERHELMQRIKIERGADLQEANQLLNMYFDGWNAEAQYE